MVYLIAYDIENNKLRKKISDRLLADGLERVQYSVFMGPLAIGVHQNLVSWLSMKLENSEGIKDNIIILELSSISNKKISILGENPLDIESVLGKRHTLFL
ncbi:MAG: CRISPR-associated endonuclease Cas2 [Bacteroidota bacterium]